MLYLCNTKRNNKNNKKMDTKKVKVYWDVDPDLNVEELGLPDIVEVPETMDDDDIADYLSNEYGYCIDSYIVD